MKIVFIGGRDIHLIGGIESYMAHLSSELVRLGHEVIVYCESNRNETVMWNGVKVIHQKSIKSHFLCKPWLSMKATLRTLWNEKGVGIIHYNAWPPSLWCWLANLFGVKTLMQGHGLEWQRSKYSPKQQKIMKFMEKVTAHMNRNLIMCSDGQTKYFRDTYNREAVTIPTAVMLPAVHDIESDIMNKYNLEPKKYFLFMGRLVQDKNPDYLIRAYKQCADMGYKLVIAGSGFGGKKYVQALHALAADNDNIIFTGAVHGADKDCLLRNAYAFCIPSTIEGLSIVLLEAMSYKLPVIASDIDANRELVGDDAVYVRPENTDDLVRAMHYCVDNPDVINGYCTKNYNKVAENYTWDRVAEKYLKYLYGIGCR